MKKLLGYVLWGHDNGSFMYDSPPADTCSKYSNVYDLNYVNDAFAMKKKSLDYSATYDGYDIVSDRFKEFCIGMGFENLEFISFKSLANFYWLKIGMTIEFDSARRNTRFLNYNKECNGHEEVIGATPVFLKSNEPVEKDFLRTDLSFGSFHTKSPLYIVSVKVANLLKEQKFKGIICEPIFDNYDSV